MSLLPNHRFHLWLNPYAAPRHYQRSLKHLPQEAVAKFFRTLYFTALKNYATTSLCPFSCLARARVLNAAERHRDLATGETCGLEVVTSKPRRGDTSQGQGQGLKEHRARARARVRIKNFTHHPMRKV